ncbi:MAG: nucleotidyl transferase AbiEii/AbiGii toxin family protein [Desulfobacterales bacterium]|jgi:predicted nucleotidyltransferase component of viral defense system|nr:nucleotidyl transferase AbiEii/AbiGii toxin family protein [Desulfobacterales bacterium]
MIPQRNLSLLSNRLARKGGRRIPEAVLELDYCLSWFLAGLSTTSLTDVLAFKGGTAIRKCYAPDYRFSEDLDFTLKEVVSFEKINEHLIFVFEYVERSSGIKLHIGRKDRHSHENSHTFYLGYEGPLPGAATKEVKIDITIKEKIVFPIVSRPVLKAYGEYEDLPDDAKIGVYSIQEIAAEKIVALIDPARNEPRDLYDLWYLTNNKYVDLALLTEAVELKMEFRQKILSDFKDGLIRKEVRLKKLWNLRLSAQMAFLPEFDAVYRAVLRKLRLAGFLY